MATSRALSSFVKKNLDNKDLYGDDTPMILKRVEEERQHTVRVWIEQVAFDQLIVWLDSLQRKYAITTASLVVERLDQPGRVNVRLILDRPKT